MKRKRRIRSLVRHRSSRIKEVRANNIAQNKFTVKLHSSLIIKTIASHQINGVWGHYPTQINMGTTLRILFNNPRGIKVGTSHSVPSTASQ